MMYTEGDTLYVTVKEREALDAIKKEFDAANQAPSKAKRVRKQHARLEDSAPGASREEVFNALYKAIRTPKST